MSFNKHVTISRLYNDTKNVILSPIAFDMEWRLLFVRRKNTPSANLVDRRTAVVQVADSSGLILVIQIYNMSRMSSAIILCHSLDSNQSCLFLGFPIELQVGQYFIFAGLGKR